MIRMPSISPNPANLTETFSNLARSLESPLAEAQRVHDQAVADRDQARANAIDDTQRQLVEATWRLSLARTARDVDTLRTMRDKAAAGTLAVFAGSDVYSAFASKNAPLVSEAYAQARVETFEAPLFAEADPA